MGVSEGDGNRTSIGTPLWVCFPEKEKMKGADLIILDALRRKPHISHFNLEQALTLLEELEPKQALLIHISHYMGLNDEVNKELPSHINLAYDGQVVNLNE